MVKGLGPSRPCRVDLLLGKLHCPALAINCSLSRRRANIRVGLGRRSEVPKSHVRSLIMGTASHLHGHTGPLFLFPNTNTALITINLRGQEPSSPIFPLTWVRWDWFYRTRFQSIKGVQWKGDTSHVTSNQISLLLWSPLRKLRTATVEMKRSDRFLRTGLDRMFFLHICVFHVTLTNELIIKTSTMCLIIHLYI